MGYPNPLQIPLPSEAAFRGICVYVPDAPEYVRALLGSLAGLSQWVNWERDSNQSASKSATLWKLANDMTLATWADDCGCDDMNCEEIRIIIREELENMTVTVTNTNNLCCCGASGTCGGQSQFDEPLPPGVNPPTLPPIPPDEDNPTPEDVADPDYQQFSCNMAHYMFYLIRQSVLAAVDAYNSSISFRYQLVKDALEFSVRPGGGTAVLDYWMFVVTNFNRDSAMDAIRQMDLNYDALVCALSGSYTASVRRDRFIAALYQMAITDWQKRLVQFCMSAIDFPAWFNPYDWEAVQGLIPASYTDRECQCIPVPADPVWVEDFSTGYNGSTSFVRSVDNEQSIAGSVSLFKSSQYGPFQFSVDLENLNGLAEGIVDIDFTPGVPNPGWYLRVENKTGTQFYDISLPAAGVYQWDNAAGGFNAGDIGKLELRRNDELYNASAPRAFSFSFAANWILLP